MSQLAEQTNSPAVTLPVDASRKEFLEMYDKGPIVVVTGGTGSGKTTKIPQYVLEQLLQKDPTSKLKVACTQPRVVAARSVAQRVAGKDERNVALGDEVGYNVRNDNTTGEKTRLVYMTDGILRAELKRDPTLSRYKCIIIDEAHERTVNTDILMAKLRSIVAQGKRPGLKVVIMSATLDAETFQGYFNNAPLCKINGTTFPVKIKYLAKEVINLQSAILGTVRHIHRNLDPGDILIFVEGINEIRWICSEIAQQKEAGLIALPLIASLSPENQARAFANAGEGTRKCIVSTNVAETSLTIDGIVYVIDSGLAKNAQWSARIRMRSLGRSTISQASANQRSGRAGRTRPGICFRMYTEATFNTFQKSTPPSIQYTDFTPTLLQLMASRDWKNLDNVGLITRPPKDFVSQAFQDLHDLGYMSKNRKITRAGLEASKLSIDPNWAYAIEQSKKFGVPCSMIELAAIANEKDSIFWESDAHKETLQHIYRQWACPLSDHVTQLNAFHAFLKVKEDNPGHLRLWCKDHFLSQRTMENIYETRKQLLSRYTKRGNNWAKEPEWDNDKITNIRKALAHGHILNLAAHDGKGEGYKTIHYNQEVLPEPNTFVAYRKHEWVVYNHIQVRARPYMMTVTAIEPQWIMNNPHLSIERAPKKWGGEPAQKFVQEKLEALRKA